MLHSHGPGIFENLTANFQDIPAALTKNRVTCMQYLGDLGCDHVVLLNDEKTVEEIIEMKPRGVLISPGPGACWLVLSHQLYLCTLGLF